MTIATKLRPASSNLCRAGWSGLLLLAVVAAPTGAPANDCCHDVMHPCAARPDHFLPACRAGTEFDLDCSTLCCLEHEFTDPCPGEIGPVCLPNLSDDVCRDSDGDGIIDGWEINGADLNGDGVIDPGEDLPAMGANPMRRDVFVESDCLVATDHTHCPDAAAIRDVVQAFADAPVVNPDGTSGVQLHVDVGPLYGAGLQTAVARTGGGAVGTFGDFAGGGSQIPEAGNTIINYSGTNATSFYALKAGNFAADRDYVFRYMIWGHQTNFRAPQHDCTSGQSDCIPANNFFVTLGGTDASGLPCWGIDATGHSIGSRLEQAGTFMHELGHNLGLQHGGFEGTNNKPDYLSVMNYTFQDCLVPVSAAAGLPGGCDYSHLAAATGGLIDLFEPSLDECVGIGTGLGFGPIDWDHDGKLEGVTGCQLPNTMNVAADVNLDGPCVRPGTDRIFQTTLAGDDRLGEDLLGPMITDGFDRICQSTKAGDDIQVGPVGQSPHQEDLLQSQNDWSALTYAFQTLPTFPDGGTCASPGDEPDSHVIATARLNLSEMARPTLAVTNEAPATVLPGDTVTFSVQVENVGHGPSLATTVLNTLPDGSQVTFDFGTITVGAAATDSAQYAVPATACPMDLTDTAEAAGRDLASMPVSGSASAVTRVLDVVPPTLSVSLSPSVLSPPNHKLVTIGATIAVSDTCDPHPTVRLVSVVSDEPDNGLGDGDQPHDVQRVATGTDDRQFLVRSERSGGGKGRTYTATYEATDASGNRTRTQARVFVPR